MRVERDPERPLLLDGAMGTELIARGLRVREEAPEAWNLERPDDVRAVHAGYVAVGVDVLQTNTFGATRPRLKRFGREQQLRDLIRAGVSLARDASAGRLVLGSLGPTGETLPLSGAGDLGWVEEAFAEATTELAGEGVDGIHLETFFHPVELEAAIRGARSATSLPVIASMTLMPGASGLETPHGVPLSRMIKAIEAAQPDAVGVNCSIEGERMLAAVEQLRDAVSLPVWAKPQAKLSQKCVGAKPQETPEAFARHAVNLARAGASAVGGCCGTGPEELAALRRALDLAWSKVAS
jgi:methionine synthase I (cobalamin-dependent)